MLQPREYQLEAVEVMSKAGRIINADEMGVGKTCESLLTIVKQGFKSILVVCRKSAKYNWRNEIGMWDGRGLPVMIPEGTIRQKAKQIEGYKGGYIIINPELLRDPAIRKDFSRIRFDCIVLDEAHIYSSRKAMTTKAAIDVSRTCKGLHLLTGTPIQNKAEDLWTLLHMIDPKKWSSFWAFVERHCTVYRGRYGYVIEDGLKDPEALAEEMRPHFIRRLQKDVLELPPLSFKDVWVDLEGEQKRVYGEMERKAFTEINPGDLLFAPVMIAKLIYLQEISINPKMVGAEWTQSAKFDALTDLLSDTDQKVVIVSQFTKCLDLVKVLLDEKGIRHTGFDGRVPDAKKRDDIVRAYNEDPDVRVFMTTIGSGGESINLTSASLLIRLDRHWNPAKNAQVVKRLHRGGQERPVLVVDFMAKDTVEEYVLARLDAKTRVERQIIGLMEERRKYYAERKTY